MLKHTFLKILIFTAFLSLLLTGCAADREAFTASGFYFDTAVSLTLYGKEGKEKLNDCLDLCAHYEDLFSRTKEGSEIYELNETGSLAVSDETLELIQMGLEYGAQSSGVFSITVAPLVTLWNITGDHPSVPDRQDIDKALSKVGDANVQIDGNTVTLLNGAQIDLGGIAKGYIADKIAEYLRNNGIEQGMLVLGGSVYLLGSKPDGSSYKVGIKIPFSEDGSSQYCINCSGKAIASSGIDERYFEQDGKIYHHILDTSTGYPVDNELAAVTIITDSGTDADALSTICFALGTERGLSYVNGLDNAEAVFINRDGDYTFSDGLTVNGNEITLK